MCKRERDITDVAGSAFQIAAWNFPTLVLARNFAGTLLPGAQPRICTNVRLVLPIGRLSLSKVLLLSGRFSCQRH